MSREFRCPPDWSDEKRRSLLDWIDGEETKDLTVTSGLRTPSTFTPDEQRAVRSNHNHRREPEGQSALPRFNRYSIPHRPRPGEVECPYCVKCPIGSKGLRDHCRASHPDKPEAR